MNFFCFPFLHFGEFSLEEGEEEGEAGSASGAGIDQKGWFEPLFLQEKISLRTRGRESLRERK